MIGLDHLLGGLHHLHLLWMVRHHNWRSWVLGLLRGSHSVLGVLLHLLRVVLDILVILLVLLGLLVVLLLLDHLLLHLLHLLEVLGHHLGSCCAHCFLGCLLINSWVLNKMGIFKSLKKN